MDRLSYLKFLWHLGVGFSRKQRSEETMTYFDVQNRKTFASFLTKAVPE